MNTVIEIEVCGFGVPDELIIKDGCGVEGEAVAITKIDARTLDQLCDEFRTELFKKAGKEFPPTCAPICSECRQVIR